jgi:type VI secretion system protein ImpH
MAGTSGRSPGDLTEELRRNAPRYRFFQAVRLLTLAQPGHARRRVPAHLRFTTPASQAFPASEVCGLKTGDGKEAEPPLTLEVAFLGLTGPSGVLPTPYTELLLERRQAYRDRGLHAFLDLFNHRALTLFYQAWAKYRFWVDYETGERDGFTRNLLDFAGVGASRLVQQISAGGAATPPNFFSFYAGLLAQKPLSAVSIAALVQGFFGVPATLEQFVGHWIHVPEQEQSTLGGKTCQLGAGPFVGTRIWDRQTKLHLLIGPLRQGQFDAFLPGGPSANALGTLLRFCLGHTLSCDVTLILHQDDRSQAKLDDNTPLRLGFNSWLDSGPAQGHADDVRFCLLA